jgi:hypothetical protein
MMIVRSVRRALAHVGIYRPRAGDVILDRYDRTEKTVEAVDGDRLRVVFFDDQGAVRRGSLVRWPVSFVR